MFRNGETEIIITALCWAFADFSVSLSYTNSGQQIAILTITLWWQRLGKGWQ
jgi:hypothetical protein